MQSIAESDLGDCITKVIHTGEGCLKPCVRCQGHIARPRVRQLGSYAQMKRSQHSRPLWIGLVACILFAPMLLAGLMVMSPYSIMIPPIGILLVGVLISGATTVLIALPLVLWLRKRGKLSAVNVCAMSILIGALLFAAFNFNQNYFPHMKDKSLALWIAERAALKSIVPGGILGLLSAAALCVGAGITVLPNGNHTGIKGVRNLF
ncbi:hypothetical protein [Dyella caseinilytica]|uniref:Uncharacterized protein n=1 Tax=Dyella caseinilytica TaxID=1849581 RepID=A0ABX7GWZ9_9GAMM|nr:hypothetical protein [Dyella caseinilytica]QRN54981.1 hypothetical protein ISN74_06455 [Dyella caseinilytica]